MRSWRREIIPYDRYKRLERPQATRPPIQSDVRMGLSFVRVKKLET